MFNNQLSPLDTNMLQFLKQFHQIHKEDKITPALVDQAFVEGQEAVAWSDATFAHTKNGPQAYIREVSALWLCTLVYNTGGVGVWLGV